jgi:hypothetical protein
MATDQKKAFGIDLCSHHRSGQNVPSVPHGTYAYMFVAARSETVGDQFKSDIWIKVWGENRHLFYLWSI